MSTLAPLVLKKDEDRRLRTGHTWIFSNEVDTAKTPLTAFEPGQPVLLQAHNGKPLGTGFVNPHSLICARLVSRDPEYHLTKSLLVHRLQIALSLRERLYPEPYYRLAFGDSDGLPGLVVDRYGAVCVVQISAAGMERVKDDIVAALEKVLHPECIIFRNDSGMRELEGLSAYTEVAVGNAPAMLDITENNVKFHAPTQDGQKTGWFYDHRANRRRMQEYVRGQNVLDVFSYVGGWGIQAAAAGATSVSCIDSSQSALDVLKDNAALNQTQDRVQAICGDAFDVLKSLRADKQHFDVIVLDPPAFVRRKKDLAAGTEAYQRLNQAAMQLLSRDGILISASCSSYVTRDSLRGVLLSTSRHVDRTLQIIEQGHQAPDHPVHPAIPETDYLKAFFCRVLPTQ